MKVPYGTLEIERDGISYSGAWRTEDGQITVRIQGMPPETTPLGANEDNPEELASTILEELVTEMLLKKMKRINQE